MEFLDNVTDLAICAGQVERSFFMPGPTKVVDRPDLLQFAREMLKSCEKFTVEDFMVEHNQRFWRGHWDETVVDGRWVRLRKSPSTRPSLDSLVSPLPTLMVDVLMHKDLMKGGLVLVMGQTGSGKTSTVSAMVATRLQVLGGMGYTIEDKPEHPLNGWHGDKAYCVQTAVASSDSEGWAKSLKGALRSQPAATPVLLFVGEIRDAGAAEIALRAAGNGFLVVATSFGSSLSTGLEAFAKLAGADQANALAMQFRVALHQKLDDDKRLQAKMLVSPDPAKSPVAAILRRGDYASLENEVIAQGNLLRAGINPWTYDHS